MSTATCTNCGRVINSSSVTSNYWTNTNGGIQKEIGVVTLCYAAFVDGKWIKGCGYKSVSDRRKAQLQKLLKNGEYTSDFKV